MWLKSSAISRIKKLIEVAPKRVSLSISPQLSIAIPQIVIQNIAASRELCQVSTN